MDCILASFNKTSQISVCVGGIHLFLYYSCLLTSKSEKKACVWTFIHYFEDGTLHFFCVGAVGQQCLQLDWTTRITIYTCFKLLWILYIGFLSPLTLFHIGVGAFSSPSTIWWITPEPVGLWTCDSTTFIFYLSRPFSEKIGKFRKLELFLWSQIQRHYRRFQGNIKYS